MGSSATYPLLPGVPAAGSSPGGTIPEPPFATDAFQVSIRRAPTKAEILKILERVTEPSYHAPIIEDPRGSIALYRQMACQFATVAQQAFTSQQSSFHLTYPTQGDLPASSIRSASMTVTMSRTRNLDKGLIAEIAAIVLFGPQGRRYINTGRVVWAPFDPNEIKNVEFVCDSPGYVGNLGHLADANGLITNPDGSAATDIVGLLAQSGRTNVYANIVTIAGGQSQFVDQGKPDVFSEADVGLYVEVTISNVAANLGRILKIVGFEHPDISLPVRRISVEDGPVQTQILVAHADDGGAFTNETLAAQSGTANDMTLLPAAPAGSDAYYFGATDPFTALDLTVSTAGVGVWTIVWEYWDGSAWTALSGIADGTAGFTTVSTSRVDWTVPGDWATTTVNSVLAYYVRARVSAFTSITTQPLGQIAYVFVADQLTAETNDELSTATGAVGWTIRDWIDLGVQITQIEAPAGGRDDTLRMLGDARGQKQQDNEADDDFRQRVARLADVVSPTAIQNVVNRALFPFNFTGRAIDVSDGYIGWFWDVDAWDYYPDPDSVSHAVADDGGVFTDESTAAQSDALDDMTLLPATAVAGDRYLFGQTEPFSHLDLDVSTVGVGDWVVEWRYWNGAAFVALSDVVDASNAFRNLAVRRISFTVPTDWATTTVGGFGPAYYIAAHVTSVTTTTTQSLGRLATTGFAFPAETDYKLLLSEQESRGWFFVIVPCLSSTVDWGFAWDISGPENIFNGEVLAGAWDIMVWDGEPTDANAAYASIYDAVDRIRAGGVGFTMIRDCNQNVAICP